MEYFDASAITSRVWMMFGVVAIMGYLFHDNYGRRFLSVVLVVVGILGVSWHQGVINDSHIAGVRAGVMDKASGFSDKAKAIGNQRYQTTHGAGGETNKAYSKHVDEKGVE